MEVRIDEQAGYCSGVVRAIGAAESELRQRGHLYCLGNIVHNSAEVERLKHQGLEVIDHQQLEAARGQKVLIRAHGEPPSTYNAAERLGIDLVDATCPIVLALQKRVKQGYEEMKRVGGQVVIYGKPGHAEVTGLDGQTEGTAVIVSSPTDLEAIDFGRPIRLYSQTTKGREDYRQLIENIKARGAVDFVAYDTVCNSVANRARQLEGFARSVDVLLFVAGAESSNGRYLYEYCRGVQPSTYLIGEAAEVRHEWVAGANRVGVSGATSTPRWLMEEVANRLRQME
ncbi:MAG: 4-hydroxy-3-methylbut-2-enyl diphosphate reductase [Bacteroidales bacterium]|nr:4-hydroxy-3-methylbut-2-enyl diphosphate reductase [Bacteroidales bacterium]